MTTAHSNATRPATIAQLATLAESLVREAEIVRELRDALLRQRAGVAESEADRVNATVDAIGRLLLTLEEARARRSAMIQSLAGDPRLPLDQLEARLDLPLPASLTRARTALREAALEVTREVSINRAVLRRAVESGEAFLQALFSSIVETTPVYGASEKPEEQPVTAGVVVDRRA